MGLFRRGGKLLRLGGGLRDCCCRDEPEVCWCPDWCRYYWEWAGNDLLPQDSLLEKQCPDYSDPFRKPPYQDSTERFRPPLPFGLADQSAIIWYTTHDAIAFGVKSPSLASTNNESGIAFSYSHSAKGFLANDIAQQTGFTYATYTTDVEFFVYCKDVSRGLPTSKFFFTSKLRQYVWLDNGGLFAQNNLFLYSVVCSRGETALPQQTVCIADDRYYCEGVLGGANKSLHLAEDILFFANKDSVSVNENSYSWSSTTSEEPETDLPWQVEGHYPTPGISAAVRRKESCRPGDPCDCTASLTNRTVLFEGKEMTYGQLDNFFFPANPGDPYSGTWWAEDPVGTFTRRDVENCDGSLNQRVKVVEVDCINEGGVDKWVAYLDHTCNERDDLTCPGPADAQRVKQWTGLFLCDENGSPTGSPTDLEVDYDVTSGTPAAECVDALQPPSFEFL